MESAKSFTEVSVTSSNDEGEEIIIEEEVIEEEDVDEDESIEPLNDTGNGSEPVKSNAPLPLHQLLANKLKNTNVTLTEPGESKPRSVKELAAAFQSPRPASVSRPKPIDTSRLKAASVWPTTEQFDKSPEQQSPKKARTQKRPSAKSLTSPEKKKPIFKLKPVNIRKVSTRPPSVRGRRAAPRPITMTESISNKPKAVDRMEVLNEGSKDDSSSSLPNSRSSARESLTSSAKNNSESESQTEADLDPTRKYDGSVSGTSSSSSRGGESDSESGSDSSSGSSFSVSSGTDASLAAKLGELGTPFEPLPIASNFITDTSNRDDPGSSSSSTPQGRWSTSQKTEDGPTRTGSFSLEREVSWSDLLGDGKNKKMSASVGDSPKDDDDSDSDSYESYETASSEEEFETDTSGHPQGLSPQELLDDQESAGTSDYETDTTYERQFAEAEGRTPPPPKRTTIPYLSPLERSSYTPMPVLNENETNEIGISSGMYDSQQRGPQLKSNSYYEKRRGRRKPFEDIPTAVAAELRNISKNDPAMSNDNTTLLGLTGWDGRRNQGRGNCFDQILKKKGDGGDILNDPNNLSPLPLPLPPRPFDPPDYDDDEISNITDRIFSPKQPRMEQPNDEDQESQRSRDFSGRFSITSFRQSNSIRNTERALEGLRTTSIDPNARSQKGIRDIPALLKTQNETVDFYYPQDHESATNSAYDDFSPSSSRAFDSRDIERQISETEYDDYYDPNRTEIVEEVLVDYDDDDHASHSRFEFNEERGNGDDFTTRKSKRFRWITCIVIVNLLLLLGIATWLIVEYFVLGEGRGSSLGPNKTPGEIREQLTAILIPALPDGGKSLDEEGSPQSAALDWLINDPLVYTYDDEKISIRFVLATFYYSTGGDKWTTNHLWLSDLDECLWYTSSSESPCTEGGRYSRLILTDNNLEGIIPDELSLLSNSLINLDLDGTFKGEIPLNIGDLNKLTTLRLSGRALSGEIPNSLYTLSNLSSLDLGQNILQGKLSGAIAIMSSLTSLSLMSNQFTGAIPREIGQLTELRNLNVDDNYFNSVSHENLGRLTKLEMLSMRNNALKGSLPATIGDSLRNLRGLFLNNNAFTGTIPDSYGNLSRLATGLDLSSNRLTGRVPESLGQLSLLKNLLVRDNALSGTVPLSWGKLSILHTLRLDSTNLEGSMPTEVCNNFNEAFSSFYVDCWKLDCPCCNFCCDGGECICRFEDSNPILCIEP